MGHMPKRSISAFLAAVALLCLCSCSSEESEHKPLVVASFYPLYIFTLNVTKGADEIDVAVMSENNYGCLHDYTLTSQDMKNLSRCDVFIINGCGMESFTEQAADASGDMLIADTSVGTDTISEDGEINAHIWLDPENACIQVRNITDALSQAFPEYSRLFNQNAENYTNRLRALSAEISQITSGVSGKALSFHDGFDYIFRLAGIETAAVIPFDDGIRPGARTLADLTESAKNGDITFEAIPPLYDDPAADLIASGSGIPVIELDPVTSGNISLTAYEDAMRLNAQKIKEGASK